MSNKADRMYQEWLKGKKFKHKNQERKMVGEHERRQRLALEQDEMQMETQMQALNVKDDGGQMQEQNFEEEQEPEFTPEEKKRRTVWDKKMRKILGIGPYVADKATDASLPITQSGGPSGMGTAKKAPAARPPAAQRAPVIRMETQQYGRQMPSSYTCARCLAEMGEPPVGSRQDVDEATKDDETAADDGSTATVDLLVDIDPDGNGDAVVDETPAVGYADAVRGPGSARTTIN